MHDTLSEKDNLPDELRRTFDAAGMTVLPPVENMPVDEASLKQALAEYFPQSEALVLVANEYRGYWPKGVVGGSVSFQLEYANARQIPAYIWLKVADLKQVSLREYRLYLEQVQSDAEKGGMALIHYDATAFASWVLDRLNREKEILFNAGQLAVLCSNNSVFDPQKDKLWRDVVELLENKMIPIWVPRFDPDGGQIGVAELKGMLDSADTILVICFDEKYPWASKLFNQIKDTDIVMSSKTKRLFVIGPERTNKSKFLIPEIHGN